ncbi:hypothetical protein WJX75_002974 [Coccomyxa subellipsoidea]|uniref:THO complex subunit 1 n=1 Tax=Coccomyxa subellipsoidea TaxID=248742 RepID=A0ABR2YVB2_9CHLO
MEGEAEATTEFDRCVGRAEESIITGLVADGAIEQTVPASLCSVELLAPWVSTNEAGQKVLNVLASDQSQIGRSILEHSVRQACATLIKSSVEHGVDSTQYKHNGASEASIPRLLDLTVYLGSQRQIDPAVVFTIMEDVMELSTIEEAQGVFGYLESRIHKLRQVYNFGSTTSHSKLSVLRICNQLLRRLSRASSSELCGRILMFLTRLLPLLDRSGLNVQGQFNTSHSTPVEDVPEGTVDSNGQPVDATFYATFWGLQDVFQHPYAAMEPSKWAGTITDIKRVLAEFTKQPVALASSSGGEGEGGLLEEAALTVKYLSSPKLMRLQLQDAALRRHFLLQALLFLHACQNPVVKTGTAAAQQAKKEALRSKQVLEAEELEGLLYAELQRTPKHGAHFCAAVRTILTRETQWTKWKSEGCQGYERKEVAQLTPLALDAALQAAAAAPSNPNRVDTGSEALNRLWNITRDNMSCLKGDANRRKTPSLQEHLAPVIMEMDPEEGIEDQYKTKKDEVYSWKALRLIARTNLPIFSKMLTATQPKPRKGAGGKEDKRERDADARAKLDLEDAVHELFPEFVPEGARRKPAAPAASAPVSAAVSEATEAPAARSGADADAGAVSSALPDAAAAADAAGADGAAANGPAPMDADPSTAGDGSAQPVSPAETVVYGGAAGSAAPQDVAGEQEKGPSEEEAAGVDRPPATSAAGPAGGQSDGKEAEGLTGTSVAEVGEEDAVQPAAKKAGGEATVADAGGSAAAAKEVLHAAGTGAENGALNGIGNGDAQPKTAVAEPAEVSVRDGDTNMAEATADDSKADGGEEDGEVAGGGRKAGSKAGGKRASAEQPDSNDTAKEEADVKKEPARATRGSKRAKTAAQ